MVEGARIDHAAHVNDAAMAVAELLEFDQAVAVALQFAMADRRTLLIIASDHETAGLSIRNGQTGNSTLESLVHPLKRMRVSSERLVQILGEDPSPADVAMQVQIHWGVRLSDAEAQSILDHAPTSRYKLQSALAGHVSRHHLDVGWASHHHTGGDVALYAYGPCAPSGLIDNTDIARVAAAAMRVDLDALTASLFADSRDIYPAAVFMPVENPDHLLLPDGSQIPFHDSVRIFPDGSRLPLGGLAVYIPETKTCHLPRPVADKRTRR